MSKRHQYLISSVMADNTSHNSIEAFISERRSLLQDLAEDPDGDTVVGGPSTLNDQARVLLRWEIAQLLLIAEQSEPPINLLKIAKYCGVSRVLKSSIEAEGRIVRRAGGYDIELNSHAPRRRQRFSLAHELAHTFFLKYVPVLTESRARQTPARQAQTLKCWRLEEELCNFGAAEFLLPPGPFLRDALELGPSLTAAAYLAERWDVSLECCCRRLTELNAWPAAFLWFTTDGEGYAIRGSAGLTGLTTRTRQFSAKSPLGKILAAQRQWHGRLSLALDGSADTYFCDVRPSRSGSNAVLMAIRAPEAESLHQRSQLKVWSKKPTNFHE